MSSSLSESEIACELADYRVVLSPASLQKLALYLELLLQWNKKINLTGIKDPGTIVRRLFGESLYLANVLELKGSLVDIGSGAGFPGLALKLVAPNLSVTLIEARHKKCAFLKEVARRCRFEAVEVAPGRFEEWAGRPRRPADLITTRAVDMTPELLQTLRGFLAPGGHLVLLTTRRLASEISRAARWRWLPFESYPCEHSSGIQVAMPPD